MTVHPRARSPRSLVIRAPTIMLGRRSYGLGRIDEAIAACRRAIELQPDLPQSHATLGSILSHSGKNVEGKAEFQACASARPESHDCPARISLPRPSMKGGTTKPSASFKRESRQSPHLATLHYNLGNAFRGNKENAKAIAEYNKEAGAAAGPHRGTRQSWVRRARFRRGRPRAGDAPGMRHGGGRTIRRPGPTLRKPWRGWATSGGCKNSAIQTGVHGGPGLSRQSADGPRTI